MSKEMAVIALGVWVVIATQLGIPFHPWLTIVFAITGVVIALVGFFLRADSIARGGKRAEHRTFVESSHTPARDSAAYDQKEGINSLN